MDAPRTAKLIYNPAAGRFPAWPFVDRARRVLEREGWDIIVLESRSGEEVERLAREAAQEECRAVFVAGGDGSVGLAAEGLAGSQTALAVLPSGTANVWAKELGLPHLDWAHWFALEDAARRLARGEVRSIDLGVCNGRSFLLWAGVGLDGRIINSIEPRERWEKAFAVAHFAIEAIWTSLGWTGVDLMVEALGNQWEGRFLLAVGSNVRAYAGGILELAPEAKIDDGLLDFWLIGGKSIRDAVVRATQILLGTHVDAPGVIHFRAAEATFDSDDTLPLHFDGEPALFAPPIQFSVRQRVLRVLTPRGGWPRIFSATTPTAEQR